MEGGGDAGHLAHDICALAARLGLNGADDVVLPRVNNDVRAHACGQSEPLGVDVRGEDFGRARCAGDADCEAADRPAPHDEHGAAGDLRGQHRVKRIAHRIHDSPDLGRDAVQREHVRGGHDDVVGEGAGDKFAEDVPARIERLVVAPVVAAQHGVERDRGSVIERAHAVVAEDHRK